MRQQEFHIIVINWFSDHRKSETGKHSGSEDEDYKDVQDQSNISVEAKDLSESILNTTIDRSDVKNESEEVSECIVNLNIGK